MTLKTRTILHHSHAYFVVQDPAAGRRDVYTVYKIELFGAKQAVIVGRELPLPVARKVVKRHVEAA